MLQTQPQTAPRRRMRVDRSYVDLQLHPGVAFHLQLLDVSGSGIGFPLPEEAAPMTPGTTLDCVLALEGEDIPGTLEIAREERTERRRLCGARFHADERFRNRFERVVAHLERAG